jgi:hypothetical protein
MANQIRDRTQLTVRADPDTLSKIQQVKEVVHRQLGLCEDMSDAEAFRWCVKIAHASIGRVTITSAINF